MKIYEWSKLGADAQTQLLRRPAMADSTTVARRVREITARVRADGDAALIELTREIDGVTLSDIEVGAEEFDAASEKLNDEQRHAIDAAAKNITSFHRAQIPAAIDLETMPGVRCQQVLRPIRSVGLYVPAGTAPLPSTALMLGIPASLAGCPERVLCSPPGPGGDIDAAVLYAARTANVSRVFKVGGAQAIAAMAYGTAAIPKVDKLFGPGNTWVTEAKAQADQDPDGAARDFPAGPSEVLVIADANAEAKFVAADLLSQAEHGPDSQVLLLATNRALAQDVLVAMDQQRKRLSRSAIIESSLAQSAAIVVDSVETAIDLSNRYAPEHLILQVENPRNWLDQIQAAGSVFLGPWAPESVGDYCSGTNHVLPTYGYAQRYSSLSVSDFFRSMTVQELTPAGLREIGPVATTLARLEGLDAHALAVSERLQQLEDES